MDNAIVRKSSENNRIIIAVLLMVYLAGVLIKGLANGIYASEYMNFLSLDLSGGSATDFLFDNFYLLSLSLHCLSLMLVIEAVLINSKTLFLPLSLMLFAVFDLVDKNAMAIQIVMSHPDSRTNFTGLSMLFNVVLQFISTLGILSLAVYAFIHIFSPSGGAAQLTRRFWFLPAVLCAMSLLMGVAATVYSYAAVMATIELNVFGVALQLLLNTVIPKLFMSLILLLTGKWIVERDMGR